MYDSYDAKHYMRDGAAKIVRSKYQAAGIVPVGHDLTVLRLLPLLSDDVRYANSPGLASPQSVDRLTMALERLITQRLEIFAYHDAMGEYLMH